MVVLRKTVVVLLLNIATVCSYSQTLFTYGNKSVSKEEFLKAYNKNNTDQKPDEKAYRDYLELYIRFKIKVQAALDKKMDTLPNQKAEAQGFRNQVVESYMKDEASVNILTDEAFERAKKDIHIAHIFVPVKPDATVEEILKAQTRINSAYEQLQKGQEFAAVAAGYSEDPAVTANKGDIGYITVFVLPYELETLAYTTPAGKFSAPFHSKAGYHIFKNLGERKAMGKIKAAHLLLAFIPGATDAQKQETKKLADSLYGALQRGADFNAFAAKYSSDNITFQQGGEMAVFGVGQYDPAFEAAAWSLTKNNEISKPVLSEFGYHIIKRLQHTPVPEDKNDKQWQFDLKQQVQQSDRMDVARKELIRKVYQLTGYKKYPYNENNLTVFTDSILLSRKAPSFPGLAANTTLISFGKRTYSLKDWQIYLEANRNFLNMQAGKTRLQLFDDYIEATGLEYYRDHLEEFNKDFAWQLNEFREGNLLFEIMQNNVWEVASIDSVGLKKYYDAHKDKYWWETSADAIIFTASNETVADETRKKLQADGAFKQWQKMVEGSNGLLQADSGRFELSQIPVLERTNFTNGLTTANVKNESDRSLTFSYIIKIYPDRQPRNFNDARGFVINDYQGYLEEKWIAELKSKYPVKVNEKVFASLPK